MTSYTITARNPATQSENRIHADDVARRYGFKGGLVPGVTVYGYVATGLAASPDWIESGGAQVRFRKPCYDGELLTIDLQPGGAIEVRSRGEVCVTGQAEVPGPAGPAAGVLSPDPAPAADARPPASPSALAAGTRLGWIPLATSEQALAGYLDKVSAGPWAHDALHPGMLLDTANTVLVANVVLGPWIHVESAITHHRSVKTGEEVAVHGVVDSEWERKGHRFVALDVAWRAGEEVVATARHVAIWQLAA